MTSIVGIIPAGGSAARFNGVNKELLPVSKTECALGRCARLMRDAGADRLMLYSTPEKKSVHALVVKRADIITTHMAGLWQVLLHAASKAPADWYLFAMPDTVTPEDTFTNFPLIFDVTCGTFWTDKPERFGILHDNKIIDKPNHGGLAWGTWVISRDAMLTLARHCKISREHTVALNAMITKHGYENKPLDFYYDVATLDDYREYLCQSPL